MVYAATGTRGAGILLYSGGKWNLLDVKLGVRNISAVFGLAPAPGGFLWLTDSRGLSTFRGDARAQRDVVRLRLARDGRQPIGVAVDSRGRAWISRPGTGTLPLPTSGPSVSIASLRGIASARKSTLLSAITFDSDDNIWGITGNAGVFYIADPDRRGVGSTAVEERFTQTGGLSSDSAQAVFTDRRGNIWIGHVGGAGPLLRAKDSPSRHHSGPIAVWLRRGEHGPRSLRDGQRQSLSHRWARQDHASP